MTLTEMTLTEMTLTEMTLTEMTLTEQKSDAAIQTALDRYDELLALERVGHVRNIDRTGREVTYERKSFDGPKAAWTSGKEIL